MTIETATRVGSLNASYPANADIKSEGDDHIRLIKTCLLNSFPVDFRNATALYQQMTGQSIRYDGTSLNFNVRARYAKWQSVAGLAIPTGAAAVLAFSSTAIENGFPHTYSAGKLVITANSKYLAFRISGTIQITGPLAQDYIEIYVKKNASTTVSGPYKFYPGQLSAGATFNNFDIYQIIPENGLSATDQLWFTLEYKNSGSVPSVISLLTGATLELYDMG